MLCMSLGGQYLCYSWRWSVAVSSTLTPENAAGVVVIDGGEGDEREGGEQQVSEEREEGMEGSD